MGTSTPWIYRPIYIFIYGLVREESVNIACFGFVLAFFVLVLFLRSRTRTLPRTSDTFFPCCFVLFSFRRRSHSTSHYLRYSFVSLLGIVSMYVASVFVSTLAWFS
jgi:hypothetical protein